MIISDNSPFWQILACKNGDFLVGQKYTPLKSVWSLKGSDFTDLELSQMLDILCLIKRAV